MARLARKVALVTGAGRAKGLGQAIALRLAAEGAAVMLHDRGAVGDEIAPAHGVGVADDLARTAEAIRAATGARVATVTGDLRDDGAIAGIVAAADAASHPTGSRPASRRPVRRGRAPGAPRWMSPVCL